MRPLELLLCVLTILSSILFLLPRVSKKIKHQAFPILLILTGIAQIWIEGFRWQLWPLIIAITLLLLLVLRDQINPQRKSRLIGILIVAFMLTAISIAAGFLLPIPQPYKITGPYQVGTTIFPLVDTSRTEIYADSENQPREIMVQVWYPAAPADTAQQAQFMLDIELLGPAIAEWIGLPSFGLSHLKYARTNAYLDAPVTSNQEKFPVLIFSHGWSGFKEQNIYQMEELASHGYIVVAINHTYGAVATIFPDGRQINRNDNALPDNVSEEEYAQASNLLVRQWAGDIGFVLNEFALFSQDGKGFPFADSLDLNRVGILGHSTGGGAATEFCGIDSRCKAALAMDLWIEPVSSEVVSSGLTQPYLFLHSETWATDNHHTDNFTRIGELVDSSQSEGVEITIEGTQHHDFTSLPLLTPLANAIGLKGPIPGDSGLKLINYYTVAFFDQYLRGINKDLLNPERSSFEYSQFVSRP